MPVKVLIPTPLRPYTDHQDAVELEGANVGELLDNLASRYGELRKHLFDEAGQLRSFVNVYVNEDDIRSLSRVDTAVQETDVVSIVPSIAGGSQERSHRVGRERGVPARPGARVLTAPDPGTRRRGRVRVLR